MRVVETKVYQYAELSDRAKERARDWFRELIEPDDYAESVIEDAADLGKLIGLDLRQRPVKLMGGGTRLEPVVYWDLDRGSFVAFESRYSYVKGGAAKLASEAPSQWKRDGEVHHSKGNTELNRIARELTSVQRRNFYRITASTSTRRESMSVDVERDDDVPMSQEDIDTVTEALQDFAHWMLTNLRAVYEYQTGDECIAENIEANEYEFDENGNRA